ncbi:MAG: hypothetical protein ACJAXN_002168 [Psychromonas sp.]|jgi:hypothetical protein
MDGNHVAALVYLEKCLYAHLITNKNNIMQNERSDLTAFYSDLTPGPKKGLDVPFLK